MGPLAIPLIAAGAELVGSVGSMFGQASANRANIQMAREQMQFQERMSNTQYQRAMADMRAAGLNPMLAYMQGGAGNLSGQTAHVENVAGDMGRVLPQVANSAMDAARLKSELELLKAQKERTLREADQAGANAQWTQTRNIIDSAFQSMGAPAGAGRAADPLLAVALRRALVTQALASASSMRATAEFTRKGMPKQEWQSTPAGIGIDALVRLLGGAADATRALKSPPTRR